MLHKSMVIFIAPMFHVSPLHWRPRAMSEIEGYKFHHRLKSAVHICFVIWSAEMYIIIIIIITQT